MNCSNCLLVDIWIITFCFWTITLYAYFVNTCTMCLSVILLIFFLFSLAFCTNMHLTVYGINIFSLLFNQWCQNIIFFTLSAHSGVLLSSRSFAVGTFDLGLKLISYLASAEEWEAKLFFYDQWSSVLLSIKLKVSIAKPCWTLKVYNIQVFVTLVFTFLHLLDA